jgi:adenosine deaminase
MYRIDPHLHLGGTIFPDAIWDILQITKQYYLASDLEDVKKQVMFASDEPKEFHRFLNKFRLLDSINWNEQAIDRSIQSVSNYLIKQGLDYTWIDFSINKYMGIGWHKHEAIQFIYDRFNTYIPDRFGLVLSIKYETSLTHQISYTKLLEHEVSELLFGIDWVGDEAYFDGSVYPPIFKEWASAGKMVRVHAGESQFANNVVQAINAGATNVAHGFKILGNVSAMDLALDKDITLDMSLISNRMTGVFQRLDHPIIGLLRYGIKTTLGSDDPVQFDSSLDKELEYASNIGLDRQELYKISKTAFDNTIRFLKSQNKAIPAHLRSMSAGY